jgi:cleavage and polyadenylation specificity factor subunit 2
MSALRNDGNVLIPVDTAGRVLELLITLDQFWIQHKLTNYSLAFLTNVSLTTIEFAKSQLEWMSDSIMNAFDHSRENTFSFKYSTFIHSHVTEISYH